MADPTFQKVLCIDPCDGTKYRYVTLLVQTEQPLRGAKASPSLLVLGWTPEPKLVNPVRLVDDAENTVVHNIHVIDSKFGNQIVQYITSKVTQSDRNIADVDLTTDKNAINDLWLHALKAPEYIPGQARATPTPYKEGEVYIDGTRSDFSTTYLNKYPVTEEVLADTVPTYCDCQVKEHDDDGRKMIQCSNGELWCLKEWYHTECISMAKEDVPPEDYDWYCEDCVKDKIGKLKRVNYIPFRPINQKPGKKGKKAKQHEVDGLGAEVTWVASRDTDEWCEYLNELSSM
jgi:hypothetical protein